MRRRETLQIGVLSLRQHPMRTALSTLGVVAGVGALVAVLSLGDGMETFARSQIAETTSLQVASIVPRTTQRLDGITVPLTDVIAFHAGDLDDAMARLPGLQYAALLKTGGLALTVPGGSTRGVSIAGVAARGDSLPWNLPMAAGTFLTTAEMADTTGHTTITLALARLLRTPTVPAAALVGDTVRIGTRTWRVAGVTADSTTLQAWVPHEVAEEAMTPGPARVSTMLLAAAGIEVAARLRDSARAWLATRFPDGDTRTEVQTNEARLAQVTQGILILKIFLGALAGVSLLVGGIGIMNILLASVAERTREIGIRRTAGARRRDVLVQFLVESVAITGIGSVAGTLLGLVIAFGATAIMRSRTEAIVHAGVSLSTVAVGIGAGVVLGLAFGTFPALRAARLTPIEAIRHE